jgi:hypothetical protein
VLARHAIAILVILATARFCRADELSVEQLCDACGLSARNWLADSGAQPHCDASCDEPFCLHASIGRQDRWFVQVDAIALQRTTGRDRPLAVAADSGLSVLDTGDVGLGFQFGPRLLIGRRTGPDLGCELSYFGLPHTSAWAVAEDPNNLDILGTLLGVAADYTGADRMVLRYSTDLHNAEANLVHDCGCWSALAGLRYFHLTDALTLTSTDSDSGTSEFTSQTHSDLIGPQLGLRTAGLRQPWGWDLTAKAGLLGSLMRHRELLLDNDNTFILRDSSIRAGSAAFVGDFHFAGFRQVGDNWFLRGGYYAMYVAGIAVGSDQLDLNSLPVSGQHIRRGDLFLHGFSLGLEARW